MVLYQRWRRCASISLPRPGFPRTVPQWLADVVPRLRRFEVICHARHITSITESLYDNPTPLLKDFSIRCFCFVDAWPNIPDTFPINIPSLHFLNIIGIPSDSLQGHLGNLVRLKLGDDYGNHSITMVNFLDLLKSNPRLVQLQVHYPGPNDDGVERSGIVTLKHLQILTTIKCYSCQILSPLVVPPTVQMRLDVGGLTPIFDNPKDMLFILPDSLSNLKNFHFLEKMSINDPRYPRLTLRVSAGILRLTRVRRLDPGLHTGWLHPIPLGRIREMWLHDVQFHADHGQDSFCSLPALEILHLIKCGLPEGFFRALHPTMVDGGSQTLCPGLRELTIAEGFRWEDIVELARARYEGGAPLKEVFIRSKKLEKRHMVAPLREVVGFGDYRPSGRDTFVCPF
jgi:hypothetical protein